jgi:Na+/melibiose symporter-like transporter
MASLTPGARRAIASLGILVFLCVYIVIAVMIGERLHGAHWVVTALYYAIVGTCWALPLKPLFDWMGRGHEKPRA